MHVLRWPKTRHLTDTAGVSWAALMEPGRLLLLSADGQHGIAFTSPAELRAVALLLHAAAVEQELEVKTTAAKELADRRLARKARGEALGLLDRPFTDVPEPPMHLEVSA